MSVSVVGLQPLTRALKRAEGNTDKELRRGLSGITRYVKAEAKGNAPTGPRPKRGDTPPLRGSIRSRTTGKLMSVYSDAAHAYVQDRGGQVGRNRATILSRSEVSHYMTDAVKDSRPEVSRRLEGVLDSLGQDFDK